MAVAVWQVGLVLDLTNSTRYYDFAEEMRTAGPISQGVTYRKVAGGRAGGGFGGSAKWWLVGRRVLGFGVRVRRHGGCFSCVPG